MSTRESSTDMTARSALERVAEPIVAVDHAGAVTVANDAASELLGAGADGLVGRSAYDWFGDAFGDDTSKRLRRAAETGESVRFGVAHGSGSRRVEVRVHPGPDGMTLCLRELNDAVPSDLSAAVHVAKDGIAVLEDGEYVYMNRYHAEIFGFEPSELIGDGWERLYAESERERIAETVLPHVESEGTWHGELVGSDRDGNEVQQEVELVTLDDGRLVCTNRDISERKRRERTMSRQRSRIRALFDKSPDGIIVHDADGWVIDANDTQCETLGFDRETLLSMNVSEFEIGLDRETLQTVWEGMDVGDVHKVEGEHRRNDGEVIPVEVWVNKVEVDGNVRFIAIGRDVTERKARERELERTQEFLERAQTTASIGGWEADLQAGTLRWTDEAYRIHGLATDVDVSVHDAFEFYHPADRPALREAFDRLTEDGESYDLELRIGTDDDARWVRTVGEPRLDDDGRVVGAIGVFQDITDRVDRRRELRETKERLDLAVEGAGIGIWDWDMRTDAVTFNDRWAEMLGLSPDDVEPRLEAWESRVHPGDVDRVESELNAHVSGDADLYDCEHRMRTADGGWLWIRDVGKVVERNDAGEPVRAVGIHIDISDGKEYEATLERTRSELRQVVDLVPDPIFAKDEAGTYLFANEATASVYGLDPESVEGRTEREFIPDVEQSDEFHEDDVRVIESGEPVEIPEEELTAADGETLTFRTTKIPYTVAGSDRDAVLGYARDITELKAYERTLTSQRDNLGVLNKMVRHDIRNCLQVIVGHVELLEDHVDSAGEDRLETVGHAAREAVEITTATREVTELLLKTDVELSGTNVAAVMRERVEDVRSNYPAARITTDGRLPDATVLADDMLGSVFRNLLENAIRHNDAAVPEVGVSVTESPDSVRVAVADNGPGIPRDQREAVFREGKQGIDSEGTGLGLYLVRTVVDRYDGSVRIEDNEQGGATFVVELPRAGPPMVE